MAHTFYKICVAWLRIRQPFWTIHYLRQHSTLPSALLQQLHKANTYVLTFVFLNRNTIHIIHNKAVCMLYWEYSHLNDAILQ